MSNIFLPNKPKSNNSRQQSVQKAMKYLREKKTLKSSKKNLLKRLQSPTIDSKSNQLLAENILASSKTQRIKKNDLYLKYKNHFYLFKYIKKNYFF